jgi:3-hydroxyisobutyrate dehydrogenase-like beta-hydroxyacid dehydrogenase
MILMIKGTAMAARAYAPAFPLCHAHKDLRFALTLGGQLGVGLPVAEAANGLFELSVEHADDDFSAVVEASRGLSAP